MVTEGKKNKARETDWTWYEIYQVQKAEATVVRGEKIEKENKMYGGLYHENC